MKIYLIPNVDRPYAETTAIEAARRLVALGVEVTVPAAVRAIFSTVDPVVAVEEALGGDIPDDCDLLLTVGGDGTMLHAARTAMTTQKPLLGINSGRLGFLTSIEANELEKLDRLPIDAYTVEDRSMLQVSCGGAAGFTDVALNDIVVSKKSPENTITLDIYCDDIHVSSFRGDGVVFATPTGSTAYSMSAGGPILDAQMGGIVVTQICPHILRTPPMVFAATRSLRVQPDPAEAENIYISCDGMASRPVPREASVLITRAAATVPMVQFADSGQLNAIDTKIKGR